MLRDRPDGFKRTTRFEAVAKEMGLKPGVFGANGDDWRRQRRMVMASFDPAHVRHYFPSLQKVAERLVGRWQAAARRGAPIDLQPDLMRYTVDTIAGLAFGAEVNTLESDGDVIQQHLDKIFPALLQAHAGAAADLAPGCPAGPTAAQARRGGGQRGGGAVHRRGARAGWRPTPRCAAHPTQPARSDDRGADQPGSGITDLQVAGNVFTMLLAGEDTTANTIAWMIDLLWRHPAALQRATDEVRGLLGDNALPTSSRWRNSTTSRPARTRPCGSSRWRRCSRLQAERETEVGDVQVPAGTVVISLMRRDSVSDDHLPRAAAFEPERWLADGPAGAIAGQAKRTRCPSAPGPASARVATSRCSK